MRTPTPPDPSTGNVLDQGSEAPLALSLHAHAVLQDANSAACLQAACAAAPPASGRCVLRLLHVLLCRAWARDLVVPGLLVLPVWRGVSTSALHHRELLRRCCRRDRGAKVGEGLGAKSRVG